MSGRDRRHGATMVENNGPHIDLQNSASASHQAIKGRVTYFIVVTRACEFGDCRGTGHPRVSRWNSPGAAAATQVASKRPPNPFISPSSHGPSLHQCRRTVGVAPERGIDMQDDHLARRWHISQLRRASPPLGTARGQTPMHFGWHIRGCVVPEHNFVDPRLDIHSCQAWRLDLDEFCMQCHAQRAMAQPGQHHH